jgi:hypothetical protein
MLVKMTVARGPRLRVPMTRMTTKPTAATAVELITQLGMTSAGASSPRVAFHRTLLKYSANTRLFTAFVPVIRRSDNRNRNGGPGTLTGTEEQDRGPREEVGHERAIRVSQVCLRAAVPRERCTELGERARTCPREECGHDPYRETGRRALSMRNYRPRRRAVQRGSELVEGSAVGSAY